jgi:hypothetical protein
VNFFPHQWDAIEVRLDIRHFMHRMARACTRWEEQRHHIPCLQDPPNVCLYTITGHITKGGVELPLLRCARGSTSLKSFYLHLARFIPGSSAGPVSYQAYLLDGITRRNSARAAAAIQSPAENLRSFDARPQEKVSYVKYT